MYPWQRLGSIVGQTFVAFAIGSYGLSAVFSVFGGAALIGALLAVTMMVETRKRTLEELSP